MFTNVEPRADAGAWPAVLGPEKRNDNSLLSQLSRGERRGEERLEERESWGIFVGCQDVLLLPGLCDPSYPS